MARKQRNLAKTAAVLAATAVVEKAIQKAAKTLAFAARQKLSPKLS